MDTVVRKTARLGVRLRNRNSEERRCLHCYVSPLRCIFSSLSAMILIFSLETMHLPLKYSLSCWIFHPVCARVSVDLLSISIYRPYTQEQGQRGCTVWYLHSVLSLYYCAPPKLSLTYLTQRVWVCLLYGDSKGDQRGQLTGPIRTREKASLKQCKNTCQNLSYKGKRGDGVIIVQATTHHAFITFCLTPSNQHIPLNTLNKFACTTRQQRKNIHKYFGLKYLIEHWEKLLPCINIHVCSCFDLLKAE